MNGASVTMALVLLVLAILDFTEAMPIQMQTIYNPMRPIFLFWTIVLVAIALTELVYARKS